MTKFSEKKINVEEFPRKSSVIYKFRNKDEIAKEKVLKKYKKLNKYMIVPLYRAGLLPLLGFGRIFLILTTKGWKTGKKRRTPLEYRRYEGNITIFSARGEEATWFKNLRANPDNVLVKHGFHHFKPRIEFVSDINQKITIMKWYVTKFGRAAKMLFGWDPKKDNPENINFSKLVNLISIIHLEKQT